MSLRITPPTAHATTTPLTSSAASAPGLPDRLSTTPSSLSTSAAPTSTHPLEARLQRWTAAQESLKLESLRRTFGIAEPVRRAMELKICDAGEWRPSALGGGSGVHGDILRGRESEIGWEDVWRGDEMTGGIGFHGEMEGRLGMNW